MCAVPIPEDGHAHVVDARERALRCVCRPCRLLFTVPGAARGRFRAVPERYRHRPDFAAAEPVWVATGIPVAMAFAFLQSTVDPSVPDGSRGAGAGPDGDPAAPAADPTPVVFYPSPAGATESMLRPDLWAGLLAGDPDLGEPEPDVEALLIHRQEDGFEAFLVPIDACYELVGRVRAHWRGFDGGPEARTEIDDFFASLRARAGSAAEPVSHGGSPVGIGASATGRIGVGRG
jgi:hypothetical protein